MTESSPPRLIILCLCAALPLLASCRACPFMKKEAQDFQRDNPYNPSKELSGNEIRRLSVILGVTSLVSPWVEHGGRLTCPEEFFTYYMGEEKPSLTLDSFTSGKDGKSYYLVYQERFVKITTMYKAAGGMIVRDKEGNVTDEEQIFQTILIGQEEDAVKKGRRLFREMVKTGNVDSLVGKDPDLEYPSGSLRYDKGEHSWMFVP
jgi:hypothetical protein